MTVPPRAPLMLLGSRPVDGLPDADNFNMAQWCGPNHPPPSWYRAFVSMRYDVRWVGGGRGRRMFVLTPVNGSRVYTFNHAKDILATSRMAAANLLFGLVTDSMLTSRHEAYRMTTHPPCEHELYARLYVGPGLGEED